MKEYPEHSAVIVVDTIKNAIRIVAMEEDVRLSAMRLGQSLSDARAINPDLDSVQHDLHADMALLEQIARWCECYTPLVSIGGKYDLFLDITGCSHLFGGEHAMLEDMTTRLNAQGFCVRLAIADTAGAAWALACYGNEKIALPDKHPELLEPLPLTALRLSRDEAVELAQVGFKTIGSLIDLPRAPITARFGDDVLRRLDQALGREDEVLSPLQPAAEFLYEKRLLEPVVHEDDIKATIGSLATSLVLDLEQRGLGIRKCRLQLFRSDGEITSLDVEASTPLRDAGRIAILFDERLTSLHDEWDAGFGFDIIRLSILASDRLDAKQESLAAQNQPQDVTAHLIDRLSARMGADRVLAYQTNESHIPERQFNLAPAIHHKPKIELVQKREIAIRPILLFDRPEIADVMAEIPEGPPIRFRWRKASYEVTRSEGPERIACEWWRDGRTANTRDYFRVETSEGYRLWLFRHGLYERETNMPKWYVHGMFA